MYINRGPDLYPNIGKDEDDQTDDIVVILGIRNTEKLLSDKTRKKDSLFNVIEKWLNESRKKSRFFFRLS